MRRWASSVSGGRRGVVAGMGGNAGTQTLAVIVRGLALGELTWSNARHALFKEGLVGVGNGLATGFVGALVAWAISRDWRIALILMAAMMINMFVAAIAGTLVPLGLRALKIDPALASSVFITTVTDMSGFLSFLGLATYFFHPFWLLEGQAQEAQMIQFMKNLSIMGAMLFIIANGSGPLSVDSLIRARREVPAEPRQTLAHAA